MIQNVLFSLRAIVTLTVLTSVIYPLFVTIIAQTAFPFEANGSLVKRNDRIVGSALLAQNFTDGRYFWPRPSAGDYGTIPSGASNQGFTSKKLQMQIVERRRALGDGAPSDLLAASGSGLDPHISPEAARFQAARVAAARGMTIDAVMAIVDQMTEPPQFGLLGTARVNVLQLNLALDSQR